MPGTVERVQPGDGWIRIANRTGVPLNRLLLENRANVNTSLGVGQVLAIPPPGVPTSVLGQVCKFCRRWEDVNSERGFCGRWPPTTESISSAGVTVSYPTTTAAHRCGEWLQR